MRVCPRFVSALLAPTLPAAIIGALFAAPFVYLVIRNIQSADTFTATLTTGRALEPLARTLALGIAVSGAAAILGTGAAWLATRTDVPGRRVWLIVLPLPLVIPSFIGAFVLIAAFAPGGLAARALDPLGITTPPVQGFAAAFTVLTLLTYPFVFLPVAARISHLPASLEESARLLGHGPLRSFFSVIMPQAASAVLAGSLLVFLYTISDFGAVQLLRFDALTRSIFSSRLLNPELALALSLQLGIVALAIVIAERGFTRSRRRIDVRREIRALRVPLQRWRLPAAVALGALVTAALLAPAGVLIYWAVRGLVRGSTPRKRARDRYRVASRAGPQHHGRLGRCGHRCRRRGASCGLRNGTRPSTSGRGGGGVGDERFRAPRARDLALARVLGLGGTPASSVRSTRRRRCLSSPTSSTSERSRCSRRRSRLPGRRARSPTLPERSAWAACGGFFALNCP